MIKLKGRSLDKNLLFLDIILSRKRLYKITTKQKKT
jgi:hypothetical protein